MFLLNCCLNHDVVPEYNEDTDNIDFQASSPDEASLLEGMRDIFDYAFISRNPTALEIKCNGELKTIKLVCILAFSSARQRMSVIVEVEGEIYLFIKGSDTKIYERLSFQSKSHENTVKTEKFLKNNAAKGLRTLCFAYRKISQDELNNFLLEFSQAKSYLNNRAKFVETACDLVENNLTLLGCTAIEDRLQDKVPETIKNLQEAGIHFWMLTGDKVETAINIGYSSNLLHNSVDVQTELFVIESEDLSDILDQLLSGIKSVDLATKQGKLSKDRALVISGLSLRHVLENETLKQDFLKLSLHCNTVIVARCSPSQKAEVVTCMQKFIDKDDVTLAIGDGANDVPINFFSKI